MQRYVAFLSGLTKSHGGASQEKLAGYLRKLGFLEVRAVSEGGNISFETTPVGVTTALEAQISRHLTRFTGEDVAVFIRSGEEVDRIIEGNPFDDDAGRVFVVLLPEELDPRVERRIKARKVGADTFHPAGREIYWLRKPTESDDPPPSLAELLHMPATVRSMQTLRRLSSRHRPPERDLRESEPTESERSRQ